MKLDCRILAGVALAIGFGVGNTFAATCPTGYSIVGKNMAFNFGQPIDGACPLGGGQKIREIPDEFLAIYNGFKAGSTTKICGAGYMDGSTCKTYTTGHCNSGYLDMGTIGASAFSAPGPNNNCYMPGYHYKTMTDEVYFIYNGFKVGSTTTLCGTDAYRSGSSCVSLTQVGCPSGYKNIVAAQTALSPLGMDGACAKGKHTFSTNQSCDDENLTDDKCLLVCPDGEQYTGVGTCAALCSAGATTLNLGNGLSIPMYDTKQIEPSINIGMTGGTCYVNLVPGATNDSALMVQYGNSLYHTVE